MWDAESRRWLKGHARAVYSAVFTLDGKRIVTASEDIAPGRLAVTKVKLRPKIEWAGAPPTREELDRLHHQAHEICFIANSVKTQVTVE